jgi:hypothetical protein
MSIKPIARWQHFTIDNTGQSYGRGDVHKNEFSWTLEAIQTQEVR